MVSVEFLDFDSDKGTRLRESLLIEADFVGWIADLWDRATPDWQYWLPRRACALFPDNTDFLAFWAVNSGLMGNDKERRALWIVIQSLAPSIRQSAPFLKATAALSYAMGRLDEAEAAWRKLTRNKASQIGWPELTVKARALSNAARTEEATAAARQAVSLLPKAQAIHLIPLMRDLGDNASIAAFVQRHGGLPGFTDPVVIELGLYALEEQGELRTALTQACAVIDARPETPRIAHPLRLMAHRLDELDFVTPYLKKNALAQADMDESLAILAMLALDNSDYDRAKRIVALVSPDKGEVLASLDLSVKLQDPSTPRQVVQKAYHHYRGLNVQHSGPEMQYGSFLVGRQCKPKDLKEALEIVKVGMPLARGAPYMHWLNLTTLVANRQEKAAIEYFHSLPESLRKNERIARFEIFAAHHSGDIAAARKASRVELTKKPYRVQTIKPNPSRLLRAPALAQNSAQDSVQDCPVVLFCVLRNSLEYLDAFMAHYRGLGIREFVMVDNGSTDGTREYLMRCSDVRLYENHDSFRSAAHGVAWINPLVTKHAMGRWALFVDIDEHLVFPHMDQGRSLPDLVQYAQSTGAGCFGSFMLDMYPSSSSAKEGFAGHRYFDGSYERYPSPTLPFFTVQGGIRGRFTGRYFLITKAPLARVDKGFLFLENNHLHSYQPPSEVTTALLHYKFIGDAVARFETEVKRREHFLGGQLYKDMFARLSTSALPRGLWTRKYKGDAQLVRMGLMETSQAWRSWK